MAGQTWVVVANSSRARIFSVVSREVLEELEGLVHAGSRMRDGDLVSDRRGRAYDRVGGGRHALEGELEPHKRETLTFALEVAHHLHESWAAGQFKKLYVAAGPTFLGILRQELAPQVRETLAGEIDKDMTQLASKEIREHFPYVL